MSPKQLHSPVQGVYKIPCTHYSLFIFSHTSFKNITSKTCADVATWSSMTVFHLHKGQRALCLPHTNSVSRCPDRYCSLLTISEKIKCFQDRVLGIQRWHWRMKVHFVTKALFSWAADAHSISSSTVHISSHLDTIWIHNWPTLKIWSNSFS